jgi:hypothetical protein
MEQKTIVMTFVTEALLVLCESEETPRDDEWDEFLDTLRTKGGSHGGPPAFRILVVTEGGGPNLPQRKRLQVALAGRSFRVAVVTSSVAARFLVSAIALLNRDIRSFARDELDKAYRHLGMNASEIALTERTIAESNAVLRRAR